MTSPAHPLNATEETGDRRQETGGGSGQVTSTHWTAQQKIPSMFCARTVN